MEDYKIQKQTIALTLTLVDPVGDSESCERETQRILQELLQNDDVEQAGRIVDPNPPEGNKAGAAFLVGVVKAVVDASAVKAILQFLWQRAKGNTIEVVIDANGKKLNLKVSNERELRAVFEEANKFVASSVGE